MSIYNPFDPGETIGQQQTELAQLKARLAKAERLLQKRSDFYADEGQLVNKMAEDWKTEGCWSAWDESIMQKRMEMEKEIRSFLTPTPQPQAEKNKEDRNVKCNYGTGKQDMTTCPMIYIHWPGYYPTEESYQEAMRLLCPNTPTPQVQAEGEMVLVRREDLEFIMEALIDNPEVEEIYEEIKRLKASLEGKPE